MALTNEQLQSLLAKGMSPDKLIEMSGMPPELAERQMPMAPPPMSPDIAAEAQLATAVNPPEIPPEIPPGKPEVDPILAMFRKTPEQLYTQKKAMELSKQQEGSIGQLQDLMRGYNDRPVQTDLSPLMALTDTWTGSKLASGYAKPQDQGEKIKSLAEFQNMSQKQRDTIVDNLTKMAGIGEGSKLAEMVYRQSKTDARKTDSDMLKKENRLADDLDKSVIKPRAAKEEQFGLLERAFETGDYQTINSVFSQFARGVSGEKGVLTDNDISRIMPKNIYGDAARVRAYFSSTPTAEMPPEYLAKLKELMALAKGNINTIYGDVLKQKRGIYKSSKSYAPLFNDGESGDMMFRQVESQLSPGDRATTATKKMFRLPSGEMVEASD